MDKKSKRPGVIILAAGMSDRMGLPKYDLRFSEEESFLNHIIKVYKRFVVSDIIVVVNNTFDYKSLHYYEDVKIVKNQNPEAGRFYSIQMGLQEMYGYDVFVQNVDNPFVNPGLLLEIYNGIKTAEFAVPVYENRGGHPILLTSGITEKIIKVYPKEKNFKDVLKSFHRKDVEVNDPYITVNMNTPEDYQKYFSRFNP